jgi:hypothetical protein
LALRCRNSAYFIAILFVSPPRSKGKSAALGVAGLLPQAVRERAKAAGQDVLAYLEQIIARELAAPLSLMEAAEPIARAVDAAGVSDAEFTSALTEVRNAARRDRRHKSA